MPGPVLLVLVFGDMERPGHGDFGSNAAIACSRQFDLNCPADACTA